MNGQVRLAGILVPLALAFATPAVANQATAAAPPAPAQATAEPTPQLYDDRVVRDIRITLDQGGEWLNRLGCVRRPGVPSTPATDARATLEVDGTVLEGIGVRCKGNSSLGVNGTKKPFNLTMDAFVKGQKLWGFDVVNLNNGFGDPSQVRESLSFKALGMFMPTPRFGYARVTLQGAYLGLYLMVEQINREFVKHWYPFADEGVMIKGDSPVRIAFNSSQLTWEGENLDVYKQNYEVKGKAAGTDVGYELLREMIRALDAPVSAGGLTDAALVDGIAQHLDVDTVLWYLAGNNLLANYDSYYVGKNYFIYRGDQDERFRMIPWDFNLAYGVFPLRAGGGGPGGPGGGAPSNPATVDPFAQITERGRPLIRRLLNVERYRQDYLAHYRDLVSTVFDGEWVDEHGGHYQALIAPAVQDEIARQGHLSGSFTYQQFETNLRSPVTVAQGPLGGNVPGVRSLVLERRAYVLARPDMAAPAVLLAHQAYGPLEPTAADRVTIEAAFEGADAVAAVELRWRVNDGVEHVTAMQPGPDGSWIAEIPAQRSRALVTYAFRISASGKAAFFPSANQTQPFGYTVARASLPRVEAGSLVINEVMADNSSTLADPQGEYDDWVEIVNRGSTEVSLEGMYLSDNPDDPLKYAFPAVVLAPGEHYLVWCDNDPDDGVDHADFRLSAEGEFVVLSRSDAIVDLIEFGPQETDVSLARLPDGGPDWITCLSPTPGMSNACGDAPVPTVEPTPSPTVTAPPPPTASPTLPTERRIFVPAAYGRRD